MHGDAPAAINMQFAAASLHYPYVDIAANDGCQLRAHLGMQRLFQYFHVGGERKRRKIDLVD